MISKKSKISYNKESGVLSIEMLKAKSVDSDIQGNMVVDYDKKGEIVRINLYGFSFSRFRDSFKTPKKISSGTHIPFLVK